MALFTSVTQYENARNMDTRRHTALVLALSNLSTPTAVVQKCYLAALASIDEPGTLDDSTVWNALRYLLPHRNLPVEFMDMSLLGYFKDDWFLASKLATNPGLPAETARDLYERALGRLPENTQQSVYNALRNVLFHPTFTYEDVIRAKDETQGMGFGTFTTSLYPSFPDVMKHELMVQDLPSHLVWERQSLAHNRTLTEDQVRILASYGKDAVNSRLASNPRTPSSMLFSMYRYGLSRYGAYSRYSRGSLANPSMSTEALQAAYNMERMRRTSFSKMLMQQVAYNRNAPEEVVFTEYGKPNGAGIVLQHELSTELWDRIIEDIPSYLPDSLEQFGVNFMP